MFSFVEIIRSFALDLHAVLENLLISRMPSISGNPFEHLAGVKEYFFPGDDTETILLAYHGDFNQGRIDSVIKLVEGVVLEAGSKRRVMKRICSVLIEMLQNISIHAAKNSEDHSDSFLVISASQRAFRIITGNLILTADARNLTSKLGELNSLGQNELRKLYVETLCNESYSVKGGAGLGFLTIAKKAIEPFHFSIEGVDDAYSYFTLEVKLER